MEVVAPGEKNVNIKTLKNAPTCFDHYSDHLQGVRRFLVKVTEIDILKL